MFRNFDEIIQYIQGNQKKKKIVVAAAHDEEVLGSAKEARDLGIAEFILVGQKEKIKEILKELQEDPKEWEILDEPDDARAARLSMELIQNKRADIPMKGLLHTSLFLKAAFHKEFGLVPDHSLVSQVTVAEYGAQKKLIMITDCAITMEPDFRQKAELVKNCVRLAHGLGYENPKVAVIAPVEVVNEKMPETIHAAMLTVAAARGQLKGCTVDGPLALDNALSEEAARSKGIHGAVAGKADILLMPNLCAGNVLDKSLRYFGEVKTGSAVIGGTVPFVVTSRSDSAQNKLHAIALSVL